MRGNWSSQAGRAFASFDARSGPSGENPTGFASWFELFGAQEGGFVTCLTVTGNRATIGVASGALLFVEDNPAPGADRFQGQFVSGAPTVCPPNTLVYPPPDFGESGDIAIRDNTAAAPPSRMVGKGSVTDTAGVSTAAYAYILNCEPTPNAGVPFEVRFADQRFRLTNTSRAVCGRGAPLCQGTTHAGEGTGTLTSGGPGTIFWSFCDAGPGGTGDLAGMQIRNAAGTLVFNSPLFASPPGPFPGSTQSTGYNAFQGIP